MNFKDMALRQVQSKPLYALAAVLAFGALTGIAGYYIGKAQHTETVESLPAVTAGRYAAGEGITRLPPRSFGHWILACILDASKTKHCSILLRAVDASSHKLVLSLIVSRNQNGQDMLVALTPPNAALAGGFRLTSGTGAVRNIPFRACGPGACRAAIPLDHDLAAAVSSSATVSVSYEAAMGQTVSYVLPSTGFDQAYAAWHVEDSASAAK
ncbi:MAG: invasion associated locus B family protein [Rhizomicrobium sp.]|jgi:invasion protein IalB